MASPIVQSSSSVMLKHENDKIDLNSIKVAANRIKDHVHHTPTLTSTYLDELCGRKLYFKCENFQKTGSFKIRGAINALLRIKEERGENSPFTAVTHSSGNHGQAVALASKLNNVNGKIVMPKHAPMSKKKAVIGYGAEIFECESTAKDRQRVCDDIIQNLGNEGEYIPSSDHPFIMEGQGSIGIEMLQDNPELDAIIVACSIGGLLSGIAVACKQIKPDIKIFACEPTKADDLAQSFDANKRIVLAGYPDTIADGLRMSVGVHTWPVIQKNVESVITVTDDEIIKAMFLIWERMKIVVEPSGAVAFAAALHDKFQSLPKEINNVGVVLCGGNMDLHDIPWIKK